jgi:hypothetical protein
MQAVCRIFRKGEERELNLQIKKMYRRAQESFIPCAAGTSFCLCVQGILPFPGHAVRAKINIFLTIAENDFSEK